MKIKNLFQISLAFALVLGAASFAFDLKNIKVDVNGTPLNLGEQLTALRNKNRKETPPEIQKVFDETIENLEKSEMMKMALNVGDKAPNFSLPNATGKQVSLNKYLQQGPVVISFYRGKWCPYCSLELEALQMYLPEIKKHGASLIAISPQSPDNSLSTVEKFDLEYEVLSDVGSSVAKKYHLSFEVPDNLSNIYKANGIDLRAINASEVEELPVPATYVVDQQGIIQFAFVDPDYTKRAEPSDIVKALNKLK